MQSILIKTNENKSKSWLFDHKGNSLSEKYTQETIRKCTVLRKSTNTAFPLTLKSFLLFYQPQCSYPWSTYIKVCTVLVSFEISYSWYAEIRYVVLMLYMYLWYDLVVILYNSKVHSFIWIFEIRSEGSSEMAAVVLNN